MAKKKVEEVIIPELIVRPRVTIAERELRNKETQRLVEQTNAKPVVDYSKPFPEAECRVCHTYTPIYMVCKYCNTVDPHRDIEIKGKGNSNGK